MTETSVVTVTREFDAAPERVFDAWLDDDALGRFLFRTEAGEFRHIEVDPRVGGKFQVDEQREAGLAQHFGEYVAIEPPRRLAFRFRTDPQGERTTVTIVIEPTATGCRFTLTHEGVWSGWEEKTRHGWTVILGASSRWSQPSTGPENYPAHETADLSPPGQIRKLPHPPHRKEGFIGRGLPDYGRGYSIAGRRLSTTWRASKLAGSPDRGPRNITISALASYRVTVRTSTPPQKGSRYQGSQ
jgi:uncharacterized protein YndB with AHSA1/START domain